MMIANGYQLKNMASQSQHKLRTTRQVTTSPSEFEASLVHDAEELKWIDGMFDQLILITVD